MRSGIVFIYATSPGMLRLFLMSLSYFQWNLLIRGWNWFIKVSSINVCRRIKFNRLSILLNCFMSLSLIDLRCSLTCIVSFFWAFFILNLSQISLLWYYDWLLHRSMGLCDLFLDLFTRLGLSMLDILAASFLVLLAASFFLNILIFLFSFDFIRLSFHVLGIFFDLRSFFFHFIFYFFSFLFYLFLCFSSFFFSFLCFSFDLFINLLCLVFELILTFQSLLFGLLFDLRGLFFQFFSRFCNPWFFNRLFQCLFSIWGLLLSFLSYFFTCFLCLLSLLWLFVLIGLFLVWRSFFRLPFLFFLIFLDFCLLFLCVLLLRLFLSWFLDLSRFSSFLGLLTFFRWLSNLLLILSIILIIITIRLLDLRFIGRLSSFGSLDADEKEHDSDSSYDDDSSTCDHDMIKLIYILALFLKSINLCQ